MTTFVRFYSTKTGELNKFLTKFYDTDLEINDNLMWEKEYFNPIEIADLIGAFIDNSEKYSITMWISLDNDVLINVTNHNADEIIKYLYERFPY